MATPIDLRDRAVLLLLATTGIRNGELRALQLQDIDWRAGEIFVRRTKGKRDRVAPLIHETGAALVLLRHERRMRKGLRGGARQHGHRLSVLARATVSLRRMVAIEFVTCRSGRSGGRVGSSTRGNDSLLEFAGCEPS